MLRICTILCAAALTLAACDSGQSPPMPNPTPPRDQYDANGDWICPKGMSLGKCQALREQHPSQPPMPADQ